MTERADAFEEIAAQMRVLGRRFKTMIAERAAEVHPQLQPSSYHILVFLIENGPTRGSALACQFDIDKGAISRQIQHLLDLGLAERTADPDDGRAQLVSASARAREVLDRAHVQQQLNWQRRLEGWSAEELRSFADQLGRFNGDLT
ncbi:MarR family transcriptional regulator [Nocardioides sp. BP30]|uniref:MarR family winged helix-turn-helix transcriptional regulator n=1 Tax=Nocardioides sp. BP30 TaxID=3036374 RepID=UPI002468B62B|nr:MarR family transcriptional regulator [Nocardioides sp. BP30]WGL51980.1 MarR family transcriptional regulator [Nocardioides sp. BP30]